MVIRRSKRKSSINRSLLDGGKRRRSKRNEALKEDESKIFGNDFGVLPSD